MTNAVGVTCEPCPRINPGVMHGKRLRRFLYSCKLSIFFRQKLAEKITQVGTPYPAGLRLTHDSSRFAQFKISATPQKKVVPFSFITNKQICLPVMNKFCTLYAGGQMCIYMQ
jgi:hypothetical protein